MVGWWAEGDPEPGGRETEEDGRRGQEEVGGRRAQRLRPQHALRHGALDAASVRVEAATAWAGGGGGRGGGAEGSAGTAGAAAAAVALAPQQPLRQDVVVSGAGVASPAGAAELASGALPTTAVDGAGGVERGGGAGGLAALQQPLRQLGCCVEDDDGGMSMATSRAGLATPVAVGAAWWSSSLVWYRCGWASWCCCALHATPDGAGDANDDAAAGEEAALALAAAVLAARWRRWKPSSVSAWSTTMSEEPTSTSTLTLRALAAASQAAG